jgi:hypothetical protein
MPALQVVALAASSISARTSFFAPIRFALRSSFAGATRFGDDSATVFRVEAQAT